MTARRRIVLTGASGGIGLALVRELARPGVSMLLLGRDSGRLRSAAEAAMGQGAEVGVAAVDVTDAEAMAARLKAYDAAAPVDLVIANAGISVGLQPGKAPEDRAASRRLIETNIGGMLNAVEPLLPAMIGRCSGHVVLVSSLAALRPLPDMPSYSASKAAVRAYGIALRGWLGPFGIRVTVVCPGFVSTPMARQYRGLKPFEVSAEAAARRICHGIGRGRALVTFPWPLALGIWLEQFLPVPLSDRIARLFPTEIAPRE